MRRRTVLAAALLGTLLGYLLAFLVLLAGLLGASSGLAFGGLALLALGLGASVIHLVRRRRAGKLGFPQVLWPAIFLSALASVVLGLAMPLIDLYLILRADSLF